MCNGGTNATGTADPIPPEALAAALVMFGVGIALVLSHGCRKKQAWQPEKTYVVSSETNNNEFDSIPLDDVNSAGSPLNRAESELSLDAGVDGLDSGLSETLHASLLDNRMR